MGELGLLAPTVSEEYGGGGMDPVFCLSIMTINSLHL